MILLFRRRASSSLAALRVLIQEHDHRYYVLGEPSATDAEYDALFDKLRRREAEDPSLAIPSTSPTQRVPAGVDGGSRRRALPHHAPMLSLESARADDRDEILEKWSARIAKSMATHEPPLLDGDNLASGLLFSVEPKIDGVAVSLLYEEGRLVRALTRGDGSVGDDVTANVRAIKSVPLVLRAGEGGGTALPRELEVRGEIYLPNAAFARMNSDKGAGQRLFSSPRNAAAGALRALSAEGASRYLALHCYHSAAPWGASALLDDLVPSHGEMLRTLLRWGLPVPALSVDAGALNLACAADVLRACAAMEQRRAELPFDIDGCVVKVASIAAQNALGATARAPRWALALKFEPHEAITVVRSIELRISRFGTATPVALFDPVALTGATISSASLHNFDELRRKDVRIGDVVRVRRAGDVIPEIVAPLVERRCVTNPPAPYTLTATSLDARFVRNETTIARLSHAASKGGLAIDGVGKSLVRSLVEAGAARSVADLFLIDVVVGAIEREERRDSDGSEGECKGTSEGEGAHEVGKHRVLVVDARVDAGEDAATDAVFIRGRAEEDGVRIERLRAHLRYVHCLTQIAALKVSYRRNSLPTLDELSYNSCSEMRGMGAKKLAKLRAAVAAAKESPSMARLLLAVGIQGVGATVAKRLDSECCGDLAVLVRAVTAAQVEATAKAAAAAAAKVGVEGDGAVGVAVVAALDENGVEAGADGVVMLASEEMSVLAAAGAGPAVTDSLSAFCVNEEALVELMQLFAAGVVPRKTDVVDVAAALNAHAVALEKCELEQRQRTFD